MMDHFLVLVRAADRAIKFRQLLRRAAAPVGGRHDDKPPAADDLQQSWTPGFSISGSAAAVSMAVA
jgi:hypothetical protein